MIVTEILYSFQCCFMWVLIEGKEERFIRYTSGKWVDDLYKEVSEKQKLDLEALYEKNRNN